MGEKEGKLTWGLLVAKMLRDSVKYLTGRINLWSSLVISLLSFKINKESRDYKRLLLL